MSRAACWRIGLVLLALAVGACDVPPDEALPGAESVGEPAAEIEAAQGAILKTLTAKDGGEFRACGGEPFKACDPHEICFYWIGDHNKSCPSSATPGICIQKTSALKACDSKKKVKGCNGGSFDSECLAFEAGVMAKKGKK